MKVPILYLLMFPFLLACTTPDNSPGKQKAPKDTLNGSVQPEVSHQTEKIRSLKDYANHPTPLLQAASVEKLKLTLDSICKAFLNDKRIRGISVQYIDLRSGNEISINPDKRYIPASLMKIPLLIAVYKLEEEKPGSMKQNLPLYRIDDDLINKNLEENETYSYQPQKSYTLEDLTKIMISHSDNVATISIMEFLNQQSPGIIERVESDLNASIPTGVDNRAEIVYIDHFADMLKVLFTCTYLSEEHSLAALQLLSSSKYGQGFRKSVPGHIPIAHKFGVRFNVTELHPEFPVQLHQVAVIYQPAYPFVLSVMTKGSQIEPLRAALREIARVCYAEIDHLSKK